MALSRYEKETIITFNQEEKVGYIFTYEPSWQQHLEKKLGLKPKMVNGKGGKEYEIDKKRIPKPRVPRKLSDETRNRLAQRMRSRHESSRKIVKTTKSEKKTSNKGKSIKVRGSW